MTDWSIIVPVAIAFLGTVGIWIKAYFDYKKRRAGNNPHPCGDHDNRLRELERGQTRVETEIKELRRDVERIERKLNGLK